MQNVLLVGLIDRDVKEIALILSERINFFYLNCEDMIVYSLLEPKKMEAVCGKQYLDEQEKLVVSSLNSYENTLISMSYETFANNLSVISQSNLIVYLRLTELAFAKRFEEIKKNGTQQEIEKLEISKIVFKERENFLKRNCKLTCKYDISKLENSIKLIQEKILEQK